MDPSLKISSYNCQGAKWKNCDYLVETFYNCDILFLQETWLYNFQHSHFKSVLPECQYHAVSAMDDADVHRLGRPFGGVAILWHQKLVMSFVPIKTNTQRICAVHVKSDNINCVFASVYMPNDDNTNTNFNIFGDVLYELSSIVALYDNCDFIIGGDFNIDYKRIDSRNLSLFKHFIRDEEFICATESFSYTDYTREDTNHNRSFLDHFLFSRYVRHTNFNVAHDGHNLSDHHPISIKTMYNVRLTDVDNSSYQIMNWNKASDINIQNYQAHLDHYLSYFSIPESIKNCNNLLCNAHNDEILKILDDFVNIMIISANDTIPTQTIKYNKKGIPGWNSHVKQFKDASIFWNDMWKQAGKPVSGQLAEERRLARIRYHWAIKQVKRQKDNILLDKTAKQLLNKSYREFWSTIKRLQCYDKTKSNVVDDACTDSDIVGKFCDKYAELYNSVTDEHFNKTVTKVNNLVDTKCNSGNCSTSSHYVSKNLIKNAILCLKSGKDDEIYEMYSDHFINATDRLHDILSQIVTIMLKHGTTNQTVNKSVIKPIPKNKSKSLSDINNYRAISKNTIISKIIDYTLMSLIDDKLITSVYQFAYKKNFSTSLCSFLVLETIQYYKSRGTNVYMLSLDCTKAFDKVQFSKLFNTLIEKAICPLIIRLIMNNYIMSTAVIKWNKSLSEPFSINNGVKQGAVLSAPLFALYIDPLLQRLSNTNKGCYIGNLCANAFAYADDIVILSPTCKALRALVNVCEIFASEYLLNFNPDKCKLLIFSSTYHNFQNINITVFDQRIEIVDSEKHLGHLFQTSKSIINFDAIIKDINIRTNIIINNFRPISWQAKVALYMSQCSSLYGCQLWQLDDPKIKELCTGWRVCSRKILGLHPCSRSYLLHNVMGTMPIDDIIMSRILGFFIHGLNHENGFISNFFKNTLISNSSYMLVNINQILNRYNIKYMDLFSMNIHDVKKVTKSHILEPDWRCNIIKELLSVRENQIYCNLDHTEAKEMLYYISTYR